MGKHKCEGPFLVVESKELFVFYKGQLIHKRWPSGNSKTFSKYGTKHIKSYE
jgi:hypothetical protein